MSEREFDMAALHTEHDQLDCGEVCNDFGSIFWVVFGNSADMENI